MDCDVRNPIIVEVSEYRGKIRMDIRHHYTDKDSNELRPTQKGINILFDDTPQLIEALKHVYLENGGKENLND